MRHDTPLRKHHEAYARALAEAGSGEPASAHRPGAAAGRRAERPAVEYLPYGPSGEPGAPACEIPAAFAEIETEYAAIRRGAGLLDCPHRATLRITGDDRIEFLNRMVTQDLKDLAPGTAVETFWLNRRGRIRADLLLIELDDEMLVAVDIHAADATGESLNEFLFTEDVMIADDSESFHHISVHGRLAIECVRVAAGQGGLTLLPGRVARFAVGGTDVVAAHRDQVGDVSIELLVPRDAAGNVWDALLETDASIGAGKRRVRPVGWFAFNMARIEGGTPLFNIDFGPDHLPHETGILERRVSFTKGCFLGQEVVSRLETQGRPKQMLVGLRMERDRLPVAGAPVYAGRDEEPGDSIGHVTSSTLSPMLGSQPIGFAMLRSAHASPGQTLFVSAEGEHCPATVQGPAFWSRDQSASA